MINREFKDFFFVSVSLNLAHNNINWTCKDDFTGNGTRRKKERQTEKEMER